MATMQEIAVELIRPHPQNPRQELGDLTELAASIQEKGILQNLTVVPNGDGTYTALIGHRRAAAAKLAGLATVPCAVREDLTEKEQIGIMLLENMQRSDLTLVEQAQGMQLMFDLGDSVAEIAKKTGFGETTVRKRLKVASLPADAAREAEARGATLEDYVRVSEIESKKERVRLLGLMGTREFDFHMQRSKQEQEEKKRMPAIEQELNAFAREATLDEAWSGCFETVLTQKILAYTPGSVTPKEIDPKRKYVWIRSYGEIKVRATVLRSNGPQKSEQEKEADRRRRKLKAMTRQFYALRRDFILQYQNDRKDRELLLAELPLAVYWSTQSYANTCGHLAAIAGIDKNYINEHEFSAWLQQEHAGMLGQLLWVLYGDCEYGSGAQYYYASWGKDMPVHQGCRHLDAIYDYLMRLGYVLCTEEQQLRDGTHPLFAKWKEKKK